MNRLRAHISDLNASRQTNIGLMRWVGAPNGSIYPNQPSRANLPDGAFAYFPVILLIGFIGVFGFGLLSAFFNPYVPRSYIALWGGLMFGVLIVMIKYCYDEFQRERKAQSNLKKTNGQH